MELIQSTTLSRTGLSPMVVAIDGSPADRPALSWAAQEASQLGRPLVISHAVGHLPPGLGYADRRVAGEQRRTAGQQVVDAAAAWIAREVPGLTVDTVVRLLEPSALLPVVGRQAHAVAQADRTWVGAQQRRGPAVAAIRGAESDAHVIAYATDYARRRDVDLVVVRASGRDPLPESVRRDASLTFMAAPGREPSHDRARVAWEAATTAASRLHGPLVRVAGTGHDAA
jgi:nucleotide-binding universal stress UspA family protein